MNISITPPYAIEPQTGSFILLVGPRSLNASMLTLIARLGERAAVRVLDGGNRFNAYSVARANQFTRPRSAAYVIKLDGKIEVVRRAETVEDVLVNQVWPETAKVALPGKTASA